MEKFSFNFQQNLFLAAYTFFSVLSALIRKPFKWGICLENQFLIRWLVFLKKKSVLFVVRTVYVVITGTLVSCVFAMYVCYFAHMYCPDRTFCFFAKWGFFDQRVVLELLFYLWNICSSVSMFRVQICINVENGQKCKWKSAKPIAHSIIHCKQSQDPSCPVFFFNSNFFCKIKNIDEFWFSLFSNRNVCVQVEINYERNSKGYNCDTYYLIKDIPNIDVNIFPLNAQ